MKQHAKFHFCHPERSPSPRLADSGKSKDLYSGSIRTHSP